MQRLLRTLLSLAALLFLAMLAAPAFADGLPPFSLDPQGKGDLHTIVRGPGHYLSLAKIITFWLVFAAWVGTTDWISRDCLTLKLNYAVWNSVVFFAFFAAFLLMLLIPSFIVGFMLLLLTYAGTLGAYIFLRNQSVPAHDRVLTPDFFRFLLSQKAKKVGVKIDAEKKADYEKGAPVELSARGGKTEQDNAGNLLVARQSPGFVLAKGLIADLLDRRGDSAMLDYTKDGVAVNYQIDGLWHGREPQDRESGDVMLAVLKTLATLDPAERRKKQTGEIGAAYNGTKYTCRIASQGVETGERVVLKLGVGKRIFHKLEELGIRDKLRDQLNELMTRDKGFVLFSSLPGGGLSTTIDVALEETDRLMRDFVAVEEEHGREHEIENIAVTTYNAAAGETPMTVLPKMIRTYPNVIVVRDMVNGDVAKLLCEQVDEGRLVVAGIRAKEAPEALLRVLLMKVPAEEFAPAITAAVNVRLVRKLCDACKVAYEPTPDVLQKLGLPAGKIQALYREPKPEEVDKICPACGGLGYLGRTGIFEVLVVDDKVREVLVKQPKLELVKKAARAAGMRSLQEEGILMVAKGVTSIAELMRVLKG